MQYKLLQEYCPSKNINCTFKMVKYNRHLGWLNINKYSCNNHISVSQMITVMFHLSYIVVFCNLNSVRSSFMTYHWVCLPS